MRSLFVLFALSLAASWNGAAATSVGISGPAYSVVNNRTTQNQSQFFVYMDMDSGFNHGFPSGLFGNSQSKLVTDPGCVYSAIAVNGCSTDPTVLDQSRGTVFRLTFAPLASGEYVGLNFEEPQNWGVTQAGVGYNLTGATQVVFNAISPTGGISVQFSVNGGVSAYMTIPQQWTTITLNLSDLGLASGAIANVHTLFGVASKDVYASNGGTVLLDNIQFLPVPTAQTTSLGLPLANQVFGILHTASALTGSIAIPPDQTDSNLATVYESSLALLALLNRGQAQDLTSAKLIADTLVYALANDNQGDPLPVAPGGYTGLHSGMFNGDIALYNNQLTGAGQKGQVRLAGYTAAVQCPQTGFCLLLDGGTGGNNAFAMLALLAAYAQFQKASYLSAAVTIGNWIYGNLLDNSGTGFGGYYTGYPDQGLAKILLTGKSTENNADIFAAFNALANAETAALNPSAAAMWTTRANIAGDFVMRMFDQTTGHFFAGTVPATQGPGAGIYPTGNKLGNDVINTFDFLDAQTFSTLAMAQAPRYKTQIDWRMPVQWVLNQFQRSVVVGGTTFQGFDLIEAGEHLQSDGPSGIAWEFTGQAVVAMQLVDALNASSQFASQISSYLSQIRQAQTSAPFGDGQGVVASTLQAGNTLPPYQQCLVTPYQCIAERVGLAASEWGIAADLGVNLLTVPPGSIAPTPAQLKFNSTVAGGLVGVALAPVTVMVEDGSGNVLNSNAAVTLTSSPAAINTTVNAVNGVATFNNITFFQTGTYTLTASSPGLTSVTSNSFMVVAPAAPPTVTIETPVAGPVSGIVAISGWALDNATIVGSAIQSVTVSVDGAVVGTATYGISRPDVCAIYPGRPGCPNVGFGFAIDAGNLSVGNHQIQVSVTNSDPVPLSNSATVTVTVSTPTVAYYEILSKNSGRVLDVQGVSLADGALIQQWDYLAGDNQKWRLISLGNGYWEILSKNSGKVLDVLGVSQSNGAQLQQWDYLGGANQQWQLVPVDKNGDFEIVSRNSGKVLDVRGVSVANGALVQQWDYLGGANQQWQLLPLPDPLGYKIVNRNSGKVMDVMGVSLANGALIQQWDYLGGANQQWQVVAIDSTYSKIVSVNSGKVLDVAGLSQMNGATLQQWDYLGGANQQWQIVAIDSTYSKIVSRNTGKVLEVPVVVLWNGGLVDQWDYLGGSNQQWQFVPVY